ATELTRILGDGDLVEGPASAALWAGIRDVAPFAAMSGAVWRLSVIPASALAVPAALAAAGIAHRTIWDWGGGRLWLLAGPDAAAAIGAAVTGIGHATLVRPVAGQGDVGSLPPEAAAVAALTRGLRAAFDPRGIFDPHRPPA
ncbi:MAG: glycolate oxidase subunit GlcE, partial [Pseudomonadota bacterium]